MLTCANRQYVVDLEVDMEVDMGFPETDQYRVSKQHISIILISLWLIHSQYLSPFA